MKLQYNCTCGAKIIVYFWLWFGSKFAKELIDKFHSRHASCHKKGVQNASK